MTDENAHVFLHYEAHENPRIFDDVKSLAESKHFHTVSLYDYGAIPSSVTISPARQTCRAYFRTESGQFSLLPEDYQKYVIGVSRNRDIEVLDEDIAAILRWRSAKVIEIRARGNVAYRLSMHVDALRQLQVETLTLALDAETYKQLKPNIFLDNLSQLRYLRLYNTLGYKALRKYAYEQEPSDAFEMAKPAFSLTYFRRNWSNATEQELRGVQQYTRTTFDTYVMSGRDGLTAARLHRPPTCRTERKKSKYFYMRSYSAARAMPCNI